MQQIAPISTRRAARNGVSMRPAAAQSSIEWRRLRQDLRQAVADGGFALHCQPRRCLRSNHLLGTDTLLRWPCRGRGMVPASVFMPLIEELGLTSQILSWTLVAACRAVTGPADNGQPAGIVSVSVPAASVRDGSLLDILGRALAETGADRGKLEIAVPACGLAGDCAATLLTLSALRDHGVSVALEDYGRTVACLVTLKHLPLTAVKLDRSLCRDMLCDQAAGALVRATIDFAHALDIQAVAAGVETAAQLAYLHRAGCDAVVERG